MTTALTVNSFWTPIFALDRLNSWVRAGDWLHQPPCASVLRKAIYWTKTHAILELCATIKSSAIQRPTLHHYPIKMRRVMVKLPCRKCNGSGSFCHWSWFDGSGEPCWGCNATGTATLKFIETQIGPIRWHTPQDKWWSSSLDVYVPFPSYYGKRGDEGYELTDWQPNQPGRPLTQEEALRDMLIVFRRWPHEVAFSLDHHYDAKIERVFKCPDIGIGEKWIRDLFAQGKSPTPARNLSYV